MKIGIITLPLHTNIGGILQAFALQTFLEKEEHNVYILDRPIYRRPKYLKRVIKQLLYSINKIFKIPQIDKITNDGNYTDYQIISKNTSAFIKNNINIIEIKKFCDIKQYKLDALIVGSDQIWRRSFTKKIENVFLDFAQNWNLKRIAYAVSFGTETWDYSENETNNCKELVKRFNLITVREDTGIKLCSEHLNILPKHVLDPTMLLNCSEYEKLVIAKKTPKSDGDCLVYLMDYSDYNYSIIDQIITIKKDLKPFYVFSKVEDYSLPARQRIQIPIEQWLRGFMDAKFVITDSFHGCVFSIIFNKAFIVLPHIEGGMSRIYSLLKQFNIEDRIIYNIKDIHKLSPINWDPINKHKDNLVYEITKLLKDTLK